MSDADPHAETAARAQELLRRHDGAELVPLLESARLIAVAPAQERDAPVYVEILWARGLDRPIPGSTLWRAAVERRLAEPSGGGPAEEILRRQLRESLERFPSLEVYWEWVRSGWRSAPRRKARW